MKNKKVKRDLKDLNKVSGGSIGGTMITTRVNEKYDADGAQVADVSFGDGFTSGGGVVLVDGSRRVEESSSEFLGDAYVHHKHSR